MVKFAGNVSELSNNLNKIGLLQIQQMNEKNAKHMKWILITWVCVLFDLDIKNGVVWLPPIQNISDFESSFNRLAVVLFVDF